MIRAAGEGVVDRNLLGLGEGRARHTHTAVHTESSLEGPFSFDSPGWRALLVE